MSETTDGTEGKTSAGADSPLGSPPDASIVEKKGWLSAILERTKPYREVIGIAAAVIVPISGGVAWAVSYVTANFATQTQLHLLECRVTNDILDKLVPIHSAEFAGKLDWRTVQINMLAQHGGGTPQSISTIVDLTNQINALNKEEGDASKAFQKEMEAIIKQCISENPKIGSNP